MNEANIENHMVLNTPDAPWNAPDATGTCDQCHEHRSTILVKVGGLEKELCQECDDAYQAMRDRVRWEMDLRTARIGDLVIRQHKTFRHVMTVTAIYKDQLWGNGIQFSEDGVVYSFTTASACDLRKFPVDLLELTVVAL